MGNISRRKTAKSIKTRGGKGLKNGSIGDRPRRYILPAGAEGGGGRVEQSSRRVEKKKKWKYDDDDDDGGRTVTKARIVVFVDLHHTADDVFATTNYRERFHTRTHTHRHT